MCGAEFYELILQRQHSLCEGLGRRHFFGQRRVVCLMKTLYRCRGLSLWLWIFPRFAWIFLWLSGELTSTLSGLWWDANACCGTVCKPFCWWLPCCQRSHMRLGQRELFQRETSMRLVRVMGVVNTWLLIFFSCLSFRQNGRGWIPFGIFTFSRGSLVLVETVRSCVEKNLIAYTWNARVFFTWFACIRLHFTIRKK